MKPTNELKLTERINELAFERKVARRMLQTNPTLKESVECAHDYIVSSLLLSTIYDGVGEIHEARATINPAFRLYNTFKDQGVEVLNSVEQERLERFAATYKPEIKEINYFELDEC